MPQTNTANCVNYTGELFLIGANQTPFLNMIGGLTGGKTYQSFEFPVSQPWNLQPAAQRARSETAAVGLPAITTYARTQAINTAQIMQYAVNVTYKKQSSTQVVDASNYAGTSAKLGMQPVQNELDFQIQANLRQMAVDVEFSFLQGAYSQDQGIAETPTTRGMLEAITTNDINAGADLLTQDMMNALLRSMANNGAQFLNTVMFVNAFQKQRISNIYGFAPESRNVGGLNIQQIETDFASLGIVWAPYMPTDEILIADLAVCSPVFVPVPGKGLTFYEALPASGATEQGQIYAQVGLDHGPQVYHGKVRNLLDA